MRPFTLAVGVLPWVDAEADAIGHDPRSLYVERFWLGILGPSATWLLRRVAGRFDESPNGFSLSLPETARALGLSETGGRHSPFMRAFTRLVQFHMMRPADNGVLEVRRRVPPLSARQVAKLPDFLLREHEDWELQHGSSSDEFVRSRAWRLALTLVDLGEDAVAVERQLVQWQFAPTLAQEMSQWAIHYAEPNYAAPNDAA
ncbi:MAG: hypothetical protein AB7L13_18435 [Acidimicrobiia bacterium]